MELLCKAHFGNDPIAIPILGTAETVKSFTPATIKEFMDKYYRSDNTFIAIVGNITPEKAQVLVEKYFEINGNYNLPSIITKAKAKPQRQFLKKFKDNEQSNVGISLPSFSIGEKLSSASNLIAGMLGGGMSSRLFQRLREELGLVYNIYANDLQYVTDGYMNIFFATNPSTVKKAILAVRETLLKLVEQGFAIEEIEKAKAQYKSAMILAAESSSYLMRAGGKYGILIGKEYSLEKRLNEIRKVTPDDINKAVKYIFDINSASVSYVGKEIDEDLLKLFVEGDN